MLTLTIFLRLKEIPAGDPPQKIRKTIDISVSNVVSDVRDDSNEPLVAPLKKKASSRSKSKEEPILFDTGLAAPEKIKPSKSTTTIAAKTYKKRDRKQSKNHNNDLEQPLIDETTSADKIDENQNTDIAKPNSQEEQAEQEDVEKMVKADKKEISKKARGRPKSSSKSLGQENVKPKSTKLADEENAKLVEKSAKLLDEENTKPLGKSLKSLDDETIKPVQSKKKASTRKVAEDIKDSVGVTTGRNRGRKTNPIRVLISISDKGLVTDLKKVNKIRNNVKFIITLACAKAWWRSC